MMWRTLQFIPASREKMLNKAQESSADALIFDLEDSVTLDEKEKARNMLKDFLLRFENEKNKGIIVRVNSLDTYGEEDLDVLSAVNSIDAIMLPKAERYSVCELDKRLAAIETHRGLPENRLTIIPLIETVVAVFDAYQTALSSERVQGMLFGAEDFSAQMGIVRTVQGSEISTARSLFAMACKAAEVEAYDTPFTDVKDEDGLILDTKNGKSLGMTGKAVIHPKQTETVNRIYTPTLDEVSKAERIIHANEAAKREGKGAFAVDGKMIDAPIVRRAENVLKLYHAAMKKQ